MAQFQQFQNFHRQHPQIWQHFFTLSNEAKEAGGLGNWSAWAVVNIIRWRTDVTRDLDPVYYGDVKVKISNKYTAYYARLYNAVVDEPFFNVRALSEPEPTQQELLALI